MTGQVNPATTMVFEHSSAPASVKPNKTKYREDETPLPVSSDPRVIRGSTTALSRKVAASKRNAKTVMSRSVDLEDVGRQLPRPTYTFEVKGHVGEDVDLSPYLVAKDDGVIPKKREVISQTDAFKERPASPPYVPRKTGIDGETQVEDVRDLFDFDVESDPIVNVIVAKTLEQAIFEVRHEEEIAALETVANQFQQEIIKEKQWQLQREAETRAEQEKHSGEMKQASDLKRMEGKVRTAVAATACMQQLLPGIFEEVVNDLYTEKLWCPPEREDVEVNVWPVTRENLRLSYRANGDCRKLVEELAEEAVKKYEALTHIVKPPKDERCILLHIRSKAIAAEGVDGEAVVRKNVEPVKIFGSVSIDSIIKTVRIDCTEKEIPQYELTVPLLTDYFMSITGRRIARDGAIMNFSQWLPDSLTLEL